MPKNPKKMPRKTPKNIVKCIICEKNKEEYYDYAEFCQDCAEAMDELIAGVDE